MILTNSTITATVRGMVGDDNSSYYLATDAQFNTFIKTASVKLPRYYKKKSEDDSLVGTSSNTYEIPSAVIPESITDIFLRSGDDSSTDLPILSGIRRNGSTIILPYSIDSGKKIVIWYYGPYSIGTDDIPDQVAEVLYSLVVIEWQMFALHRRTDFAQWAATTRSDARISDIRQALSESRTELATLASNVGSGLEISDIWGGV